MGIYGLLKLGLTGNNCFHLCLGLLKQANFPGVMQIISGIYRKTHVSWNHISCPHIPFIDLKEMEGKGLSKNSEMSHIGLCDMEKSCGGI